MDYFEVGKVLSKRKIAEQEWVFRISSVLNPSVEEIALNEEFNLSLANYEPEKELPTKPLINLIAESNEGEKLEFWWDPTYKKLGPHVSKSGWSKGVFTELKGKLSNWKLST